MSDFLTRRNGVWHFVRRVPIEFAEFDRRGIVRHSTRIKVADDRTGRRAARIALTLNEELERFWQSIARGHSGAAARYNDVRRQARSLGYDYIPNSDLIALSAEKRLERLEALVVNGLANNAGARQVLLGTAPSDGFPLSRLFDEYETITKHENRDLSPDQLRIWRNSRKRAVAQFVKVVGDKPIIDLSQDDGLNYVEWWRDRVVNDKASVKTANKDIGQLSRMLKEMSIRRRLNLPELFKGLQLRGETDKSRMPYDPSFIQTRFLGGALGGLNEQARLVLYVMIETGLRPSEIVNLKTSTILLEAPIPYSRTDRRGKSTCGQRRSCRRGRRPSGRAAYEPDRGVSERSEPVIHVRLITHRTSRRRLRPIHLYGFPYIPALCGFQYRGRQARRSPTVGAPSAERTPYDWDKLIYFNRLLRFQ